MRPIENLFNEDMKNIYFTAKRDINYTSTRFMQLVSKKGGLQAAKQLIAKEGGTYGFEVLWENKRLDLSVETLVLKTEYESLFSAKEKRLCSERLKQFGYTTGERL